MPRWLVSSPSMHVCSILQPRLPLFTNWWIGFEPLPPPAFVPDQGTGKPNTAYPLHVLSPTTSLSYCPAVCPHFYVSAYSHGRPTVLALPRYLVCARLSQYVLIYSTTVSIRRSINHPPSHPSTAVISYLTRSAGEDGCAPWIIVDSLVNVFFFFFSCSLSSQPPGAVGKREKLPASSATHSNM